MTDSYVHADLELLDVLPIFRHGGTLTILVCVGLFDADPMGASFNDLLAYTGLSQPTVRLAVRFLTTNGYIEELDGFYRPKKFFKSFATTKKLFVRSISTCTNSTYMAKKVFSSDGSEMPTFEEQIDALDRPARESAICHPPTTPLAKYLAEMSRYGHRQWQGFISAGERDDWLAMEQTYAEPDIRGAIDWACKQKRFGKKVLVSRVLAAVNNRSQAKSPKDKIPAIVAKDGGIHV